MSSSSSAAYAMPPAERDAQLLSIGKQCSHPSCQLVDFLPFKCPYCEVDSFCQEHFKAEAHSCPKYDESKHNRVAPNCPLCNQPVACRVGQDPNVRMEEHFVKECSVMLGKTVKKSTPICARGKCGKVLFAPIRCDKCQKQFCPTHRFPSDHSCNPTPSAAVSNRTRPGSIPASSRLLNLSTKTLETKASAASAATVGAIKKTLATTSMPSPTLKPSSSTSGSSHSNPFSKTDRLSSIEPTVPSITVIPATTNPNASIISSPTPATVSPKLKSNPEPVVRTNSFVPRPIFATA